jgi:hypothetical protein
MKRKTNVEFLNDLMEYSKYGSLTQGFIILAIQRYSEFVRDNPLPKEHFISSIAWSGIADEILSKLKEQYDDS